MFSLPAACLSGHSLGESGGACNASVSLIKASTSPGSVSEGNETRQGQENNWEGEGRHLRKQAKRTGTENAVHVNWWGKMSSRTETHSLWSGCVWSSVWFSACVCIRWAPGGSAAACLCSSPPRWAPSPASVAAPGNHSQHGLRFEFRSRTNSFMWLWKSRNNTAHTWSQNTVTVPHYKL